MVQQCKQHRFQNARFNSTIRPRKSEASSPVRASSNDNGVYHMATMPLSFQWRVVCAPDRDSPPFCHVRNASPRRWLPLHYKTQYPLGPAQRLPPSWWSTSVWPLGREQHSRSKRRHILDMLTRGPQKCVVEPHWKKKIPKGLCEFCEVAVDHEVKLANTGFRKFRAYDSENPPGSTHETRIEFQHSECEQRCSHPERYQTVLQSACIFTGMGTRFLPLSNILRNTSRSTIVLLTCLGPLAESAKIWKEESKTTNEA